MKIMCLLIALAFLAACETLHIRASRTLSDATVSGNGSDARPTVKNQHGQNTPL